MKNITDNVPRRLITLYELLNLNKTQKKSWALFIKIHSNQNVQTIPAWHRISIGHNSFPVPCCYCLAFDLHIPIRSINLIRKNETRLYMNPFPVEICFAQRYISLFYLNLDWLSSSHPVGHVPRDYVCSTTISFQSLPFCLNDHRLARSEVRFGHTGAWQSDILVSAVFRIILFANFLANHWHLHINTMYDNTHRAARFISCCILSNKIKRFDLIP